MTWVTRFTAEGKTDGRCWARECMWPGENYGVFCQGRGYTQVHETPRPVCSRRHLHGCPSPAPEPHPENGRCCYRPDYRRRGDAPPKWRQCSTCGEVVPMRCVRGLNALPTLPGVPCRHEIRPSGLIGWYECTACIGMWERRPREFEPPERTVDDFAAELARRLGVAP